MTQLKQKIQQLAACKKHTNKSIHGVKMKRWKNDVSRESNLNEIVIPTYDETNFEKELIIRVRESCYTLIKDRKIQQNIQWL